MAIFKPHNPGCGCCDPPPDVDYISYDDDDVLRNRIRSGPTEIWTDSSASGLAGIAYAPGFSGGGVFTDNRSGTTSDGVYDFNISSGAEGSLIYNFSPFNNQLAAIFNECAGVVCVHGAVTSFDVMRAVDSSGTVVESYTHAFGNSYATTNGCIRRSNGDLWRSQDGATLDLYDHQNTSRLDLTSEAVTSTTLRGLTSTDGDTLYVLGLDAATPDDVELFAVNAGAATAELLTSHTARNTGEDAAVALTKIGNYLFWGVPGDQRVWRWHVPSASLVVASDLPWVDPPIDTAAIISGDLTSFTKGFFAPR